MNVTDSNLSDISKIIKTEVDPPAFVTWASALIRNKEESQRLVVITSYTLSTFKQGKHGLNLDEILYLYEIESIKLHKDRYIIKFFDKFLIFTGETSKIIAEMAASQSFLIFFPHEVPEISTDKFQNKDFSPTPVRRFFSKLFAKGYVPSEDQLTLYSNVFSEIGAHFDCTSFGCMDGFVDCMLFAIAAAPNIIHLTVSASGQCNFWMSMSRFIKTNRTIQWLTILQEKIDDEGFTSFCDVLKSGCNDSLMHLEFKDVCFDERTMNALVISVATQNIAMLSFNHCGFNFSEKMLNSYVASLKKKAKIKGLGFHTTYFLNRAELLNNILNIASVSLRGCGIELAKLFKHFSELQCIEMDFSSNPCTIPLYGPFAIPEATTRLVLNGIYWNSTMLMSVIRASTEARQKLSLSLANAQMDDSEYQLFEIMIRNEKPGNVEAFTWNNNILTSGIEEFIVGGEINFLGLAGVDLRNHNSFLSSLKVEYLDIHGTTNKLFGYLTEAMKALSSSNVQFVNISHNDCGIDKLDQLGDAIENYPVLRCLDIDHNKFVNFNKIKQFANRFKDRKKLYIFVPYYDIQCISSASFTAKLQELKNLFHFPKAKRSGSVSAVEWESSVRNFYMEENVAIDVDEAPLIPTPNSDYCIDKEEDSGDQYIESGANIWELDVMKPPTGAINLIQEEISSHLTIPKLVEKINDS